MKYDSYSFSRRSLATGALLVTAVLASCKSDTPTGTGVGTPAAVAVSTAPAATSQVATAIPGPAVVVTGAGGSPVAGVIVKFTVSGGGAVQFPLATTDASGIASAGFWQIGPKLGANVVTATVEGLPPVTFTVASQAGPAAAIGAFSGNAQSGAPGSALPNPLVVRVTDAGGNVKSGTAVTFTVTSGGGSIAGSPTTTDASGLGKSGTWTLGTGQCGQSVRAAAGTLLADFTASSRGSLAVEGTASGSLTATDCLIDGKLADEYDITTPAGAIAVSMVGTVDPLAMVVTSDGTATVASGSSFRLITAAGAKAVRATSNSGTQTGSYSVSVASAATDVTTCGPVYIEIGASTNQTLSTSDCKTNIPGTAIQSDAFLVYIPAGITVRITETAQPLDAELLLISPTGSILVDRDNGGVGPSGTEKINFTATTSGFYKIAASSYCALADDHYQAGCDYGAYTLTVIKP